MDIIKELNEPQQQAVLNTEGPSMIIAGAGSGKTRVLTYRIAHLIEKGVDPFSILALTFTNKAAREMKERVGKLTGGMDSRNAWVGTFHSLFARILRIEAERIGYPRNFTIYDTQDSKSLIKTLVKEMGLDDKLYKPGFVQSRISNAKNNLISPKEYKANVEIMTNDEIAGRDKLGELYQHYWNRCFRAGAMDFDDLLFKTNVLFRNFDDVLYKYQGKFKYILVDEYQDTNYSQYLIVKQIAARHENIAVVGDDAQSIYAFRGANIQNILNFKKDYPDYNLYKLEQNYRSTDNIVQAANSVIAKNEKQIQKEVWTENPTGEKIKVIRALTDNEEGGLIAQSIFETQMNEQALHTEFVILYRTNAQSRALEEALRKINIPYQILGGLSFYQRKEVKDLLAYFRVVANNNDEESLMRIINYPARGIGKTTIEKIQVHASEKSLNFWQVISDIQNQEIALNGPTKSKLADFVGMIKSFAVQLEVKNAYELGEHITKSTGIMRELYSDKTPEGISRYDNIQEVLNGLKEFSGDNTPEEETRTLSDFLIDVALLTDVDLKDTEENKEKVTLMTIHMAKGLEFAYVYIAGLEENLFPSQMSLTSKTDLEEERRLFYVALTRAEKRCTLSYALTRYKWGNLNDCEPSRFITEIDEKYLEMPYDFSNTSAQSIERTNSFKEERKFTKTYGKKKDFSSKPKAPPVVNITPKNLKKLSSSAVSDAPFEADDTSKLQIGMEVEHQRFGKGKVLKIEGGNPNQKATVFFPSAGQKQLLLRFAKLKIIS